MTLRLGRFGVDSMSVSVVFMSVSVGFSSDSQPAILSQTTSPNTLAHKSPLSVAPKNIFARTTSPPAALPPPPDPFARQSVPTTIQGSPRISEQQDDTASRPSQLTSGF
jgi:hypothetical protein